MHQAKKRFGQNFLHDDQVLQSLIRAIGPKKNDLILEIGPGQGALTDYLLRAIAPITAVEIDRDLIALLEKKYTREQLQLIQSDILHFNLNSLKAEKKLRVVGNLPYNISTPLLFHLYDQLDLIEDMHFMLQKEVAERICAPVGDSQYGRLSIMSQYYCQAELLFIIGPESFDPAPKVESAFVRLTPLKKPREIKNFKLFAELVAAAFTQRRKTISNSLKRYFTRDELEALNIDPQKRPQELSIEEFMILANAKTWLGTLLFVIPACATKGYESGVVA